MYYYFNLSLTRIPFTDTTLFKQSLYTAIDHYISEKKYDKSKTSGENIDYFVNSATDIYVNQISIPFFSVVANYIYKAQPLVNGLIIGLSIAALIIAAIIFLTNKYRHRRFRYLCYGLLSELVLQRQLFPALYCSQERFLKSI